MSRPKFDSIYSEAWGFEPQHGVGIRMTGRPTGRGELIAVLARHFCPLDIAYRIAEEMVAAQLKVTTVLSHLDFDAMAVDLARVGVKLEIVPPRKHLP